MFINPFICPMRSPIGCMSRFGSGATDLLLAAYYDSVETCQLQVRGRGIPSSTHTETYTLPDADGIFQDYGEDEAAWSLGRTVKVFGGGTNLTAVGTTLIPVIEEEEPGLWRVEFPAGLGSTTENFVRGDAFDTTELGILFDNISRITVKTSRSLVNSEQLIFNVPHNIHKGSISLYSTSTDTSEFTTLSASKQDGTITSVGAYLSVYPIQALETPLTIWIKDWQLEQSTGRSDLVTPSEIIPVTAATNPVTTVLRTTNPNSVTDGIVTEGVGTPLSPHPLLYSGPGATNLVANSHLFSAQSGTATITEATTSIHPTKKGFTTEDTDAGTVEYQYANTSNTFTVGERYTARRVFNKELSVNGNAKVDFNFAGGTLDSNVISLNCVTGAYTQGTSTMTDSLVSVVDKGDYWLVLQSGEVVNDDNTVVQLVCSPVGYQTDTTTQDTTLTGEVTIHNQEVYKGLTIEQVERLPLIYTSGAAASIDENRPAYDAANYSNARMGGSIKVRPDGAGLVQGTHLGYGMGPDVITNGDFSAWTAGVPDGWGLSGNDANNYIEEHADGLRLVSDNTLAVNFFQTGAFTVGNKYLEIFTKNNHVSGEIRPFGIGATENLSGSDTDGVFLNSGVATMTPLNIFRDNTAPTDYVMNSISLRELNATTYPTFSLIDTGNNQLSLAGNVGEINSVGFVVYDDLMWLHVNGSEVEGPYSGELFDEATVTEIIMGYLNEYPMGMWDIRTFKNGTYEQLQDKVKQQTALTDDNGNYILTDDGQYIYAG